MAYFTSLQEIKNPIPRPNFWKYPIRWFRWKPRIIIYPVRVDQGEWNRLIVVQERNAQQRLELILCNFDHYSAKQALDEIAKYAGWEAIKIYATTQLASQVNTVQRPPNCDCYSFLVLGRHDDWCPARNN